MQFIVVGAIDNGSARILETRLNFSQQYDQLHGGLPFCVPIALLDRPGMSSNDVGPFNSTVKEIFDQVKAVAGLMEPFNIALTNEFQSDRCVMLGNSQSNSRLFALAEDGDRFSLIRDDLVKGDWQDILKTDPTLFAGQVSLVLRHFDTPREAESLQLPCGFTEPYVTVSQLMLLRRSQVPSGPGAESWQIQAYIKLGSALKD